MSEPRTSPVRFTVLEVRCRHCGERIEINLAGTLTAEAQLQECERQAEEKHRCPGTTG